MGRAARPVVCAQRNHRQSPEFRVSHADAGHLEDRGHVVIDHVAGAGGRCADLRRAARSRGNLRRQPGLGGRAAVGKPVRARARIWPGCEVRSAIRASQTVHRGAAGGGRFHGAVRAGDGRRPASACPGPVGARIRGPASDHARLCRPGSGSRGLAAGLGPRHPARRSNPGADRGRMADRVCGATGGVRVAGPVDGDRHSARVVAAR